jgi:hypothetical protein
MQPALRRRRHRRSDTTISLVSRGYAVGCYARSPSQRWKCIAASSARHPFMRAILPLLSPRGHFSTSRKAIYVDSPVFAGLIPSGHTPSSALTCGLINHLDRVMTYVGREVTSRSIAGPSHFRERELVLALPAPGTSTMPGDCLVFACLVFAGLAAMSLATIPSSAVRNSLSHVSMISILLRTSVIWTGLMADATDLGRLAEQNTARRLSSPIGRALTAPVTPGCLLMVGAVLADEIARTLVT